MVNYTMESGVAILKILNFNERDVSKNTKVEHQTKEKMILSEQMIAWQIYEQRK